MTRIRHCDQLIDLQILENKSSEDYKSIMKGVWKLDYQLLPPNIHRSNAAKRSIQTFKAHFLEILSSIDEDFPKNLLNILLSLT